MFKNVKSIKTKMVVVICLLVSLSLSIVGGTVCVLMYQSSIGSLEQTMTETAAVSADLIYEYLETFRAVTTETGLTARLSNEDVTMADKKIIMNEKVARYGFLSGNIVDLSGKGLLSNESIADTGHFKAALNGETSISNVIYNDALKQYIITVAAPLWADGKSGTRVVGAVYFNLDASMLSDVTNKISIGKTGSTYMLDAENYTIAHKNIELVQQRDNTLDALPSTPALAPLVALEARMKNGENGFGIYEYGGVKKILAFAPVVTGQGWSVAVNAELNEFIQSTIIAIIITIIFVIASIIIGIIVSFVLSNAITKPIIQIQKAALNMAKGDYDVQLTHKSNDELGNLSDSMRQMVSTTKAIILDTSRGLYEISIGNFDIAPRVEYIGVFKGIEDAMKQIIFGLSDTMQQIIIASEQVSSGSDQVSSGAQALAQGATEQASSVQQLAASINEIDQQVRSNAENAQNANIVADTVSQNIEASNRQMTNLMSAMTEISQSSTEISKIIKAVEDIAFQTNILALNAAVEAARAGAAGKGFAVVADEVRNLATKSSEAAKQTNSLIEGSVNSVRNGSQIANDTAKSLTEVVSGSKEITELITKIAAASREQTASISEINIGVEQISAVVQTNSATSEQSAAASEELSGQASMMNQLISKFKLLIKN